MVIEDLDLIKSKDRSKESSSSKRSRKVVTTDWSMAAPIDRVAAFLVDTFVILSPLLILVASPFKRSLVEAVLLKDDLAFIGTILVIGAVCLITAFCYITVLTWKFGATFGMLFMNLRVVKVWSGRYPDLWHSSIRTAMWFVNLLLLGLPNLSVFSNKYRRSFQDRVSDTIVITKSGLGVASPSFFEKSLVHGFVSAALAFVVTFSIGQIFLLKYELQKRGGLQSQLLFEDENSCTGVDQALEDWPGVVKGSESHTDRLEVAMALYAAGVLAENCLDSEAEKVFTKGSDLSLGYLARAFIYSDDSKLSNSYLDKACESDRNSQACVMSRVVSDWANNDRGSIIDKFEKIGDSGREYVLIWGVRQFLESQNYNLANRFLTQLSVNPSLHKFVAKYRSKALWGAKRFEEARAAASVSYGGLRAETRAHLSGWICHKELNQGCRGIESESCRVAIQTVNENPIPILDEELAVSLSRAEECGERVEWSFEKNQMTEAILSYRQLITKLRETDLSHRGGLLEEQRTEFKENRVLYYDFQRRIAELEVDDQSFQRLVKEWSIDKLRDLAWESFGERLMDKVIEKKLYQYGMEVGGELIKLKNPTPRAVELTIISAFKSGQPEMAWKLYKDFEQKPGQSATVNRGLASVESDSFLGVQKELHRRYGEK